MCVMQCIRWVIICKTILAGKTTWFNVFSLAWLFVHVMFKFSLVDGCLWRPTFGCQISISMCVICLQSSMCEASLEISSLLISSISFTLNSDHGLSVSLFNYIDIWLSLMTSRPTNSSVDSRKNQLNFISWNLRGTHLSLNCVSVNSLNMIIIFKCKQ